MFSPFVDSFFKFWHIIWWAVLLGLLISGLIDALIPQECISAYLAHPGKRSIFYAALLGFFMSVCSHGILAISIELYKKGASVGAVITFLLASPWANIGVTIMLLAFFGAKALFFILAALIIAICTGLIYQILERANFINPNQNTKLIIKNFSVPQDIKNRWNKFEFTSKNFKQKTKQVLLGSWSSAHMVLWWIIIGTLIGSALDAFVPHHILQNYLGPSFTGLAMTLILATVIEVCSEGSAPIAFSIYEQTGAFGNVFIFLMAGVITDMTEIGLVWANIGRRPAILLPLITVPQAIIFAYFYNIWL